MRFTILALALTAACSSGLAAPTEELMPASAVAFDLATTASASSTGDCAVLRKEARRVTSVRPGAFTVLVLFDYQGDGAPYFKLIDKATGVMVLAPRPFGEVEVKIAPGLYELSVYAEVKDSTGFHSCHGGIVVDVPAEVTADVGTTAAPTCSAVAPIHGSFFDPMSQQEIIVAAIRPSAPTIVRLDAQWSLGSVSSPCGDKLKSCQYVRHFERRLRVYVDGVAVQEEMEMALPDVVTVQMIETAVPAGACVQVAAMHRTDYVTYNAQGNAVAVTPHAIWLFAQLR